MKKQLLTAVTAAGIFLSSYAGAASAHEMTYTVQSGDTLWRISHTNNLSVTDLKAWNNLNSDTIYVNQKLSLLAPHSHEYTVQKGDTLYRIGVNNNVSVAQLKSINNLTSDTIYVGQVLKLWVPETAATPTPAPAPAPAPTVSKAQLVVDEAKKLIGTPYLWGGNTPAGFDCSGFTKYVFGKVGISIPRTAATQWSGLTPITSPKPGDLVFYETYAPGPTHVGIYIGDNKFINAGSKGVTISDMSLTYWKSRYLGARTAF
ncbi:NlpC/P60 family protein [Neobacillus sp. SAB-20_R2A]|uniref:NlpC/P60 family protein n=1 Tax=Neobacillus sp. SAB-20_R2A TaxID=3120519 RepID=UPI003C6DED68